LVLNSPRGTGDVFGEDINYRDFIISTAKKQFRLFNYSEIITPAFEHTEVFDRSIGESTDIVRKEMYTFLDRKNRSLTLRPEGTASVVRAVIEHKLYKGQLPLKIFYIENMFRYERPQKGRMREFWQLGVEAVGTSNPAIDAEVIWLLNLIFEKLGFKNLKLLVNSVGCTKCRQDYINVFKKYLEPHYGSLCDDCKQRYEKNPLRIFDCKVKNCSIILADSPKIYSYICSECRQNFTRVTGLLDTINVRYRVKNDLVRGFDYYTGIIFEIISEDLESVQNALGGGGRYDNLVEEFGGPSIPSIGFAVGIDRTVVLMKQLGVKYAGYADDNSVFIVVIKDECQPYALELAEFFRNNGYRCDISFEIKSIGTQIKSAEKNGFSHAVVIGEDEVRSDNITVKNIKNFKQSSLNWKKEPQKIVEIFRNRSRTQ